MHASKHRVLASSPLRRLTLAATLLVLLGGLPAAAMEAILLDVERGERPDDPGGECALSLSEEHGATEGGISLKVAFPAKGGGWAGQSPAKRRDWTGFRSLCFHAHSVLERPTTMSFVVKDAGSTTREEWAVLHFELRPGSHDYALDLAGLRAQSGRQLDLAAVRQWHFSYRFFPEAAWEEKGTAPLTLYLSRLRLRGEPARAEPPVAGQGIRVTGTIGNRPVELLVQAGLAKTFAAPAPPPSERKRPKMPEITKPVMFDTPEADRILAALQVFPPDNPWNEDISDRPLHPNSKNIIAATNPNRHLWFNLDMGFILVPPDQPRVPVKITDYPGESDKGPFPIPDNAPIEGWPLWHQRNNPQMTLDHLQRHGGGDRHVLVVDPVNRMLYELFAARKTDAGWQAAQASVFDLKTNKLRPLGWTSADAAGLPIFPAAARYEECERGMVEHAMRVTVRRTRREYVYPATHFASPHTNPNYPRMGERLRLRKDFDISGFSPHAQAILKGLKKYGMFVADNGMDWLISIAPDRRLKGLEDLKRLRGRDFEVILPTGPHEGPRAR